MTLYSLGLHGIVCLGPVLDWCEGFRADQTHTASEHWLASQQPVQLQGVVVFTSKADDCDHDGSGAQQSMCNRREYLSLHMPIFLVMYGPQAFCQGQLSGK